MNDWNELLKQALAENKTVNIPITQPDPCKELRERNERMYRLIKWAFVALVVGTAIASVVASAM